MATTYLLPTTAPPAPVPIYGHALEDVFSGVIQGILGFTDGSLIRPRWQPEPPNQPAFNVDWVAFGIINTKKDWQPWHGFDPDAAGGLGGTVFERDEELLLLHSFYGPNGWDMQSRYEDGIQLAQNRVDLTANGIKLMSTQEAYNVPALLKERWVLKVDQRVVFRRRIRRQYLTRSLLGASSLLDNEQYLTRVVVTHP